MRSALLNSTNLLCYKVMRFLIVDDSSYFDLCPNFFLYVLIVISFVFVIVGPSLRILLLIVSCDYLNSMVDG